jgi:hypothetical protein
MMTWLAWWKERDREGEIKKQGLGMYSSVGVRRFIGLKWLILRVQSCTKCSASTEIKKDTISFKQFTPQKSLGLCVRVCVCWGPDSAGIVWAFNKRSESPRKHNRPQIHKHTHTHTHTHTLCLSLTSLQIKSESDACFLSHAHFVCVCVWAN